MGVVFHDSEIDLAVVLCARASDDGPFEGVASFVNVGSAEDDLVMWVFGASTPKAT